MQNIILCDFDGTITQHDVAVLILERYAKGWKIYDDQLIKGEISIQECMIKQYQLINASQEQMNEIADDVVIRPGFKKFIEYCNSTNIPVKIVSAGIDFVIERVMSNIAIDLEIYAAKTILGKNFSIEFPSFDKTKFHDFKEAIVSKYKNDNHRVIFIGDGGSDYYAASIADIVFAVKHSNLAQYCSKHNIHFIEFQEFSDILESLQNL